MVKTARSYSFISLLLALLSFSPQTLLAEPAMPSAPPAYSLDVNCDVDPILLGGLDEYHGPGQDSEPPSRIKIRKGSISLGINSRFGIFGESETVDGKDVYQIGVTLLGPSR